MIIDGIHCFSFEPRFDDKDEVAVKWDDFAEEYIIPSRVGNFDEVLHEDGTWRKPHPHALAAAWSTCVSMNRRHTEGRNRRRNKL